MLLLLLALAASPATPIAGTVRDPGGRPAAGVLVIARDSARGMTHLAVTDVRGAFRFASDAGATLSLLATTPDGAQVARRAPMPSNSGGSVELTLAAVSGPARRPSSAAWLATLPDGETRRRFVLDCTGCHQFDETRANQNGARRSAAAFADAVQRMLGYAGPRSSFPVISAWAEGDVAGWIARGVSGPDPAAGYAGLPLATDAVVTEYDFPAAPDLPHDLAVDATGTVIVTGMFSHAMYRLDPASGAFARVEIPVPQANPRAVEIDSSGAWWVLLGGPGKVGRFDPVGSSWRFFDIGMYPHSIAVARDGHVWFNGHFTRDPEQIGRIDPGTGAVQRFDLPPHPTLRTVPGGPIPYEQRIGPDGRVWVSELQGNRMIGFDPATGRSTAHSLPTSWSGPRRFDVGPDGIVWIPAYAANALVRLDPRTGRFSEIPLPLAGATPYIARVEPGTGAIWIGTSAADAVFRYDPPTGRFAVYPLPTQGALIRHLAVDAARGDVWLAYGASPARAPARIARLRRAR